MHTLIKSSPVRVRVIKATSRAHHVTVPTYYHFQKGKKYNTSTGTYFCSISSLLFTGSAFSKWSYKGPTTIVIASWSIKIFVSFSESAVTRTQLYNGLVIEDVNSYLDILSFSPLPHLPMFWHYSVMVKTQSVYSIACQILLNSNGDFQENGIDRPRHQS